MSTTCQSAAELGPWALDSARHVLPAFAIGRLPRTVYLRSEELSAGQVFAPHAHPWNQLVYATWGSLIVLLEERRYVITPEQAIWLPTGTLHASGSKGGAAFRSLYVADAPDLRMPDRCTVLAVPALLRALIMELDERAALRGEDDDLVEALILGQLRRARPHDSSLPWPRSTPLRLLCEALYGEPGDQRTVDQWGRQLAIAPRTLVRRFEAEVGMTLRAWRHRLRLFRALEWLGAGRCITEVAMDLGYASPSAFAFMFRREMGCTPGEWRRRR